MRYRRLAAGFVTLVTAATVPSADAADSAAILMYHRFGEAALPSVSVPLERFESHIAELSQDQYTVLQLPEIVAALMAGEPLPERTVAITVDDAYLSAYREAWPRLKEAGFPFTVFVTTGAVDRGDSDYMNWDQLREMFEDGVTIGSQTVNHPRLTRADGETVASELRESRERIEAELGVKPTLLAYPYGEFSLEVQEEARKQGYVAAFGQHSGINYSGSDMYGLARFTFNERFSDLDRLRMAANGLPIPVSDVTPADPVVKTNPPPFGFTVDESIDDLSTLRCYSSTQGRARLEILGGRRVEVRVEQPFASGRLRFNCTMPAGNGRWRWFGVQFLVP